MTSFFLFPGRARLRELLARQSAAILVATHDLEFAAGLCTRFVLLEQGGIAFDGESIDPILSKWQGGAS